MKSKTGYIQTRIRSFGYALKGIVTMLRSQAHAKIHLVATLVVIGTGIYFQVSAGEWCILILAIALVWVAEALNTAIEFLTDLVSPDEHPLAGKAKDVAAGAVLIAAIASICMGIIVFYPHLKAFFS
jgi:diacylglycerol kinase